MNNVNEALLGRDMFGEVVKPDIKGILKNRYLIPPFSVLSARDGDWQTRKRQWISLGIQSELGRGESVTWGIAPSGQGTGKYSDKAYTDNAKRGLAQSSGQDLMRGENPNFNQKIPTKDGLTWTGAASSFDYYRVKEGKREHTDSSGTSIFDPVLCELMYSWFCPEGGQVIDPFAGGSVRGIVAAVVGYRYWGSDLSRQQVEANDYNPNIVAKNELRLLYVSILHDGYTQPLVTIHDKERDKYILVDGFHRYLVMLYHDDIRKPRNGLLPIVVLDKPLNDRMASTIRHNRARGKHNISGLADVIFRMLDGGWGDEDICSELGMEADELIKLKYVTGFAKLFEDIEYKKAWETKRMLKLKRDYTR